MLTTSQLQEEVIRLKIRISELERENGELKNANTVQQGGRLESPKFEQSNSPTFTTPSLPPPLPPPFLGGAPPPPPMGLKSTPKIQIRKPKCKVRGLFWTKLKRPTTRQLQRHCQSIWDQVEQFGPTYCLDDKLCSALENDFSTLDRSNSQKDQALTKSKSEPKFIQVLDSKRATNLSIQASGLPTDWLSALENIQIQALSDGQIEQLRAAIPSKEDLAELEAAQVQWPNKELGLAERFLLQLGSINWSQELLTCWSFLLRYPEQVQSLKYRINVIRSATLELRLDDSLAKLMGLILTAGNFLNNGTTRGDAYGFNYGILPGLLDMKNNAKNSHLLGLIKLQIKDRKLIDSENLASNFQLLSSASKFLLTEVDNNCQTLLAEHSTCLRMQDYVLAREPDSRLLVEFNPKLISISEELNWIKHDLAACHADLNELLSWFGLNVSEMSSVSSADFFSLWSKFLQSVGK